jgi:hypothetical protein
MNTPLTPKVARTERENFQAVRAELDHADGQLERGEYTEYDEITIQDLAEQIKNQRSHPAAANHGPSFP